MKVRELKKLLEACDDEDIVILQKDGEGNEYSPLTGIDVDYKYKAECAWCGEIGLRELTPELIKLGYSEEDLCEDGENAVLLIPTN